MSQPSRLLVVEDEVSIRGILAEFLALEGYEVIEAADGLAALKAMSKATPDLILLDLQMPRMSGWALLRALKASANTLPVIILSAQMDSVSEAIRLGAVDLLEKPFDLDELLARVARYTIPYSPPYSPPRSLPSSNGSQHDSQHDSQHGSQDGHQ